MACRGLLEGPAGRAGEEAGRMPKASCLGECNELPGSGRAHGGRECKGRRACTLETPEGQPKQREALRLAEAFARRRRLSNKLLSSQSGRRSGRRKR